MKYLNSIVLTDTQANRFAPQKCYDIAIVGAGISSAYTLIHCIARLEQQSLVNPIAEPVKILVTEKTGEFWTGIPYGDRSGANSLLISTLKEFISQQGERDLFTNWLTENRDSVFALSEHHNGELTTKWLQANEAAMAQGLWDNLFIPRYTFGLYLKQRLTNLLQTATTKGLIEIDLITAEVLDIQSIQDIYRIYLTFTDEDDTYVFANKVVLAIGSPPNVSFEHPRSHQTEPEICYIDNLYEPSLDFNIDRICQSLQQSDPNSPRQVLIVGSNASTLETLYNLNNSKIAASSIDKLIILSPNATFPHRIDLEAVSVNYRLKYLEDLIKSISFTAKQILSAVEQDIADATAKNINIADIYHDISKLVLQALDLLSLSEQQQFVSIYSVEIGKLQRRAGAEYLNVVEDLITQYKLEFIKGKFVGYFPLTTIAAGCEYLDGESHDLKVFEPINAIVNCAGFQGISRSTSTLIQNLIRRKICIPNDSDRGFLINQNFETSKNFYLMGPLVAGNIDGNLRVWHAESCQRIIDFSQTLANILIRNRWSR